MPAEVFIIRHKPGAVSLVRRVDTASWKYERLDFVALSFQVSAHLLENHPVIPINDAENVFAQDVARSDFPNCSKHFGPQVAVVRRTFSLSGLAEGLAVVDCNSVGCVRFICLYSNIVNCLYAAFLHRFHRLPHEASLVMAEAVGVGDYHPVGRPFADSLSLRDPTPVHRAFDDGYRPFEAIPGDLSHPVGQLLAQSRHAHPAVFVGISVRIQPSGEQGFLEFGF